MNVYTVHLIYIDSKGKVFARRYWRCQANSYEEAAEIARERHPGYSQYAVAKES